MENLLLLSVGFNTDIFEANLINIVLLVVLLFNVVGDALKTSMLERKEKILSGVQDAEQRLNEATERLAEAKTQLEQSKLIIDKIKSDKEATRSTIAYNNGARVKEEALRRADSAKLTVMYKKQQVLREVKEQVSTLSLNRVITILKDDLTLDKHLAIINNGIARIGGQ
jgi:F-type H+-transporting ATPase subunit b